MEEEVEDVDGLEGVAREKPADLLHQVGFGGEGGKPQQEGCGDEEGVCREFHSGTSPFGPGFSSFAI